MKEATVSACQAKGCVKQGNPQPFTDYHDCGWIYFICDEHYRLLPDRDLQYIARTEGTKS